MRILMVAPQFYEVAYAINSHMRDAEGNIHTVDGREAIKQWENLKSVYEKLGCDVVVLDGQPGFPDMVFCANQFFPFVENGKKTAVLSKMRFPERQGEVSFFHAYLEEQRYEIFEMPESVPYFEGMGDALLVPGRHLVIGGCGPRTHESAYEFLNKKFGFEVLKLKLVHPDFYHLDTCVAVLRNDTVAYVEAAIENANDLRKIFPNLIKISEDEAKYFFAGNAFSPDGHHVILQRGAKNFCNEISRFGFTFIEVDTREFIKAGGSVFCMKMLLP